MRRFRNYTKQLNLKYIIGEIVLIFIGISLAIWFNNWNTSVKSIQDKEIVIKRVKEEIVTNLKELLEARKVNQNTIEGFSEYSKFYGDNSNEVITTLTQMNILQKKHPSFFKIKDSIEHGAINFKYSGGTFINLELVELTEIAWMTARSISIANEFSYDCLYELESMYNLQTKVMKGFDKVANALGDNEDLKQIIRLLKIVNQLEAQLEQDYRKNLEDIEKCN
jgi:hypothetical protein